VSETLSVKERLEYIKTVNRARNDPVWFLKEIMGWTTIFPKQEEIIREFYQHKYDPNKPEYKKLIIKAGQRCLDGTVNILTMEYGNIPLKVVYDKFHSGETIHVKNHNNWVPIDMAFYVGFKNNYQMLLENGNIIHSSIEHKFLINGSWKPLKNVKVGDPICCYNSYTGKFYDSKVVGWDQEEFTCEMYDLSVSPGHCYVANDILVHNSGKTVLGGKIATFEFFELASLDNPHDYFNVLKSQPIAISCVAAGREQAMDGIYAVMRNDIEQSEWFNQWFDLKITEGRITCPKKNVFAQVTAAKAGSGAGTGYTSKFSLADEIDLFQQTDSKVGAEIVWSKMVNSTQSLGIQGKCMAISSTQFSGGMIEHLYTDGIYEPTTLTYDLKTWECNPRLTEELLREEYKYKMDMFWRDFANRPDVSGGLVFPQGVRFNRNVQNVFECESVPYESSQHYHILCCDPAYRNDSFGMSCGYRDGNRIVVDGVMKFEKQNSTDAYVLPSDIEKGIEEWVRKLNVTALIYDVDTMMNIIERADREWGVETIKHIANSEVYGVWMNLNDNVGEFDLDVVYNEHLKRETDQLVKLQKANGLKIDHTAYSSKDLADTVAHCIWYLANNEGGTVYTPSGFICRI